jgi:hypothetical protein
MLVGNAVSMLGAATRVCTKGGRKKNKGVGAGEVPKAESARLKRESKRNKKKKKKNSLVGYT